MESGMAFLNDDEGEVDKSWKGPKTGCFICGEGNYKNQCPEHKAKKSDEEEKNDTPPAE
eukprot:CAMPEP_0202475272 /NCGR_PEP_ID=MMETSP1360-20130828/92813_1 /ASSEMBLY_ACC=CAM_ASM_000848 /TAXON_ID=515479 /ORGANISM="Licmophora paradoxa, Strain CCMP2313" /LENGTH=58 /DNA_ID=CAMNT_0049102421 /DNA_START=123 /DNA_END=299 /DNA_ORIENTATION=+